jgi:hypothetical protein
MRKVYDKCIDSPPINVYCCSHCASMNVVFMHDTSEKICKISRPPLCLPVQCSADAFKSLNSSCGSVCR